MPGDIGITPDGKRLMLTSGPDHAKQCLTVETETAASTYEFDRNLGFPILEILGTQDMQIVELLVRDWLISKPQIDGVDYVQATLDRPNRLTTIEWQAITPTGTIGDVYQIGVTE